MRISLFNSKSGITLIEVMIALIIIAIVILGGGMFFVYGRVQIVREAHRRAATLVASGRLERLKAADYSEITPEGFDPGSAPYWIVWNQEHNKWQSSEDPSYDYVMVDNLIDQKMVTQAWCIDDDGDGTYDYLQVRTTVEWRNGTTKTVSLDTLIAPK